MLAYIGANLLITERADAAVRDWAGERQVDAIFASPPPVLFWRRDLVWREDGCYRRSSYDPLRRRFGPVSDCQPTNMDDPIVREAIRRDPRAPEIPQMVDPAAGGRRPRALQRDGLHRRCPLRRGPALAACAGVARADSRGRLLRSKSSTTAHPNS